MFAVPEPEAVPLVEEVVEVKRGPGRPRKIKPAPLEKKKRGRPETKARAAKVMSQKIARSVKAHQKIKAKYAKVEKPEKVDEVEVSKPSEAEEQHVEEAVCKVSCPHGVSGGRPRMSAIEKRGICSGVFPSNSLPAGAERLKKEIWPKTMVDMCKYMKTVESKAESRSDYETHVLTVYKDYTLPSLELIRNNEMTWIEKFKAARVHSGRNLKCGESELVYDFSMRSSVGVRKEGGGNTLLLRSIYEQVAQVFEAERACGHPCTKEFLYDEWMFYGREFKKNLEDHKNLHSNAPRKYEKPTKNEIEQLVRIEQRLEALEKPGVQGINNRAWFKKEIPT